MRYQFLQRFQLVLNADTTEGILRDFGGHM